MPICISRQRSTSKTSFGITFHTLAQLQILMPSFSNCFVLVTALLILGFDNLCVAKVPGPFSFVHCSFVLFFCAVCYTVEDGNFSAELIWRRRLKDSFDLQFKLSQ